MMKRIFICIFLTVFAIIKGSGQTVESKIDPIFQQFDNPDVSGASVMVIKEGKVVFKKGYGLSKISPKIFADDNSNYLMGEITKQFTGLGILILREKGKLSLEDNLNKFFKGFPEYGKTVTIKDLLHHTSGLKDYKKIVPKESIGKMNAEGILNVLQQQDSTKFEPGTRKNYNDYDYVILGLIIEKASRMSYAKFMKKYIFKPLKMESAAVYGNKNHKITNRVLGSVMVGDAVKDVDDAMRNVLIGNDGIYMSINDYYKWDQALYSNKLVSKETLKLAFLPGNYKNGKMITPMYGYGWFMRTSGYEKYLFHAGSTLGFTNFVYRNPNEKMTVVLFINFDSIFGIRKGVYKVVKLFSDIHFLY